jgi:hypothetical protein
MFDITNKTVILLPMPDDGLAGNYKKHSIASNFGVTLCADGTKKCLSDIME